MGSSAQYIKQPPVNESLGGGLKTVATAGTRVQLTTTSTPCVDLMIQALRTNSGRIYVGGAAVAADTNGIYLTAGQSLSLNVINLTEVWIDSSNNGEGVTYVYTAGY